MHIFCFPAKASPNFGNKPFVPPPTPKDEVLLVADAPAAENDGALYPGLLRQQLPRGDVAVEGIDAGSKDSVVDVSHAATIATAALVFIVLRIPRPPNSRAAGAIGSHRRPDDRSLLCSDDDGVPRRWGHDARRGRRHDDRRGHASETPKLFFGRRWIDGRKGRQ